MTSAQILVIEDDETLRTEVSDWLSFEGYKVIKASNGKEGVELALQHLPDLVISDINMPEKSGYRVLIEMRTNPTTALIPVIYLTARVRRVDVRYGMEIGAEDYITKPFTNEELLAAVKAQLQKVETVHKNTEQQLGELKATLTRKLPHDLRNPLVSILGFSELLGMDAHSVTPDKIEEMANAITRSGQRLVRVIENYQLHTQMQAQLSDPEITTASQSAHIDSPDHVIAKTCERIARKLGRIADFKFVLDGDCKVRIRQVDLENIVTELVENAVKFSPAQTVIEITTSVEADTYQIQIVDHGRGMSQEEITKICEDMRFRQLDGDETSGLGLIIAKRLVEFYHGSLDIYSRPRRETKVTVRLAAYDTKVTEADLNLNHA